MANEDIVFNGNAGNRSYRGTLGARFVQAGFSVLLFDYRGYGGNPGSPSEDGLAADARAARQYLTTRPDVDQARIVYFGESLGAAVAVGLAVVVRRGISVGCGVSVGRGVLVGRGVVCCPDAYPC